MEHLQHFGLSEDPFRNEPRLRDFFDTAVSRGAMSRLERGLRQAKGLLVLTGGVGSGKTMILRQLLEQLEEEVFEASMLVVLNGAADAGWMLTRFAKQLGVEKPEPERESLLAQVHEQLTIVREEGRHAVLLIDDAHALGERNTLREVCGLLKLEYEERRLFSLVLAGGPGLDLAIASDPTLAHKVEVKVPLRALDADASAAYLVRRIQQAGGSPSVLDEQAQAALYRFGAGLPGRMNILADNALFEAFLCGRASICAADVERAHQDLGWDMPPAGEALEAMPPGLSQADSLATVAGAGSAAPVNREPGIPVDSRTGSEAGASAASGAIEQPEPGPIARTGPAWAGEEAPAIELESLSEASAPPATVLEDDLDSDLEAVFEVGDAEMLPSEGPPKEEEEDLIVELLSE